MFWCWLSGDTQSFRRTHISEKLDKTRALSTSVPSITHLVHYERQLLHAVSGADKNGKFHGKGKKSFFKAFWGASAEILIALKSLGQSESINDDAEVFKNIEKLVCSVYMPGTDITQLSALRWHFFAKKNAHGEKLPPTLDSLTPAIKRANYTCMEWARDRIAFPNLPEPSAQHGWN